VSEHRPETKTVSTLSVFAPAKLNLFLAITGRRADGFHELVSVVAPVAFGDTLKVEANGEGQEARGDFSITSDDANLPCDETNLVLKAARAFVAATDWRGGARFSLEKRIPVGAGLGGGSSDAAATLRALNEMAGTPLAPAELAEVATKVGSDCALFLAGGPVVMRGRGEIIEPLAPEAAARLRGRRVLIFKPAFGVATSWAYAQMAAKPETYLAVAEAEARLATWQGEARAPVEALLFNNMERVVFAKYLALPVLLDGLRARFGLAPRMSGSGSACFALLGDPATGSEPVEPTVAAITAEVREAWGASAFVIETRLA
jgi:4-diphosphocytidyl-2-C-methyl-D-erythritol kinase